MSDPISAKPAQSQTRPSSPLTLKDVVGQRLALLPDLEAGADRDQVQELCRTLLELVLRTDLPERWADFTALLVEEGRMQLAMMTAVLAVDVMAHAANSVEEFPEKL